MKLISQESFWKAVKPGALTYGDSFYVRPTGFEKMCRRAVETKNDLIDSFEFGFSSDNGKTWPPLRERRVHEKLPSGGTLRRWILPGFVDPLNGRLLTLYNEAVMPRDDALADGSAWEDGGDRAGAQLRGALRIQPSVLRARSSD